MADEAARRRELRRKKILENAEERKRKIFGTTSPTSVTNSSNEAIKAEQRDVSPQVDQASVLPTNKESSLTSACPTSPSNSVIPDEPITHSSENNNATMEDTYTEFDQTRFASDIGAQNGSVPNLREQLLNINRLLTANGTLETGNLQSGRVQDVNQQATSVRTLKPSMVPIFIALLVCALLSNNLGYVVSNSISVPFLMWELHHLWSQRLSIHSSCRSSSGLLGVALMLCGVRQATVSAYALIITVFKCFMEDFALYIFTVVMWHSMIGLPVQEPGVVNSTPSTSNMPKEDFWESTDVDNSVEDF